MGTRRLPGLVPDKASAIASGDKANTTIYEGYINFTGADLNFKLTSIPAWSGTNFGKGDADNALSTDGGAGNLQVPTPGYYLLKANTEKLTWSAEKTTWAVIGSGTANGWDNETPMTYDAANGIWTVTTALSADGEVKFRANNAWDLDYGDRGANGLLERGADNIKVPGAGNYTITLDLSKGAGNYTYSFKKK